ncbi:MAG: hypothetical protein IT477_10995, partial [Rhodanobacteraceae bacterium]|nr:hypothetical protein [Rhodanobacteraceae bacterium]
RAYPTTGGLVKVEEFVDVAAVRGQPTPAERLDWPDPNLAQVFTASGWSLVPRALLKGREAQWEMARVYERRGITVLASRRLVMQLKPGSDPHAVAKVILKNDLGVYETEGAHLMLAIREDGLFDPIDIVMALQKETCVLTIDPVWIDPTFQESPRGLAPPTPSLIEGTLSPMNRKKTWFLTTTGVRFDLRSPRAEDVRAYDIAQSLSRQNRFLGHTAPVDPYNVAQHSVLGAEHILATTKDERLAFEFLMHDAHEAYVGDIIRPLKAAGLSEVLKPIVAPIDRCVREKFGLPAEESPLVKEIDNRMLASERLVLYPWWHHYAEQVDGDEQAEPIPGIVDRVWGHVEAKNRFLDMLRLLGAYTENDVWIEYQMQCLRF